MVNTVQVSHVSLGYIVVKIFSVPHYTVFSNTSSLSEIKKYNFFDTAKARQ